MNRDWYASDALREGKLVRVLSDWKIQDVDINAVYPSNRNITPKVRGFVNVLAAVATERVDLTIDVGKDFLRAE